MFFEFDLVLGFEDGTGTTVGVSHLLQVLPWMLSPCSLSFLWWRLWRLASSVVSSASPIRCVAKRDIPMSASPKSWWDST